MHQSLRQGLYAPLGEPAGPPGPVAALANLYTAPAGLSKTALVSSLLVIKSHPSP